MTAGRQNIWHEVRAVCIFALLYCTLNGAISQGKHNKRSGIMEMRRLQYIQTKQLKSQYLMQLLLCKRRMYNQLYFGRGKPAPLRKARGIVRLWEGWCGVRRWCNDSSNLFLIIAVIFREGQARSPTKSERDSAVVGGLVRGGEMVQRFLNS